ncbi:MAG: chitobiase/beta-hexosaminidase C-terminal domain-containing protein [Bacteroidales bacterium]|nr:chitobiase/beta-hexosaminidase C-terminal domain-containing protein [Bacteroidales bacterium]
MKKNKLLFLFLLFSGSLFAQIDLPALFSDNMVLQQQFEAPFWGWANAGEEITIKGSWNNETIKAITDKDGKWMLKLPTPKAGGPYYVTINEDTLQNIMIGEVWICSGQSNMQYSLEQSQDSISLAEIRNADYPNIHLFYVARDNSEQPNKDCYGKWEQCNPESASSFSAVAYYFGKEIHNELNIPVGLIHTSWGGSSAQAWVNYNVLKTTPDGQYYFDKYKKEVATAAPGTNPRNQQTPSSLYNGMLKPLIPFGIRGTIWYQGEANVVEHSMYTDLMNTMITNWRDEWDEGSFPFYYVQLAPFDYKDKIVGAALRDAQRKALKIANTGMAVTLDIGDPEDIHPTNKKDVGHRLALWALAKTYGKEKLVYSGPLYKSMKIEDKKIRLYFDHVISGLLCKGEKLTDFQIAGEDKIFFPADAMIDDNKVLVSSKQVKNPLAVRFAFRNGDEPNFFNKEGLPASTFRTDDWSIITDKALINGSFNNKTGNIIVSINTDKGKDIRYTLDGTEPGIDSKKYSEPFSITDDALIMARVFVDGKASLIVSEMRIEKHLATGRKVMYKDKYEMRYSGGGSYALVNSVFGSMDFKDGRWQGFQGDDMEIVIDFEKTTNIFSVTVNCLQVVNSWIIFPKEIEVYTSDNGRNFTQISVLENEFPLKKKEDIIHSFKTQFKTVKTKYLKVVAKNYGALPEWHNGAGEESWIFVDEIVVE